MEQFSETERATDHNKGHSRLKFTTMTPVHVEGVRDQQSFATASRLHGPHNKQKLQEYQRGETSTSLESGEF